jgi:2-polyprenyl-3-methyl-5-hydroxy-6-metoxy-1,4-benzoquinol methylase
VSFASLVLRSNLEEALVVDDVAEANRRWRVMLDAWAIPENLLAGAPVSPYFFDPEVFIAAADDSLARAEDTVSDGVAREALLRHGSVLDVGVGAGAASLRLNPGHVTGVDPSPVLLDAFAARADERGIANTTVEGSWPEVAAQVAPADVVVCHHLVYNIPDLASFAAALASHAERRVVIELTAAHPMAWMAPYWQALHGLSQPQSPTVEDAVAVFSSLGFAVQETRWERMIQMVGERGEDQVTRIARRLCLTEDRLPDLRRVLRETPPPATRSVVTVWW